MDNQPVVKNKYRLDIILIAILLLASVALLLTMTLLREEGATVVVEIDGTVVATYSLNQNGEYSLNGGTNVLTISDGVAYMSYSECRGHQCEKMGKIKYVGELIECAPNHIKIVISGSSDDAVDFVS